MGDHGSVVLSWKDILVQYESGPNVVLVHPNDFLEENILFVGVICMAIPLLSVF